VVTKLVVFQLDNERYALPIEGVERIMDEVQVTPIPRTPKMFMGVFDLRGDKIPVVDLRKRFDLDERKESGTFVVASTPAGRCALRTDRVLGIWTLEEDDLEEPPSQWSNGEDPFLDRIAKTDQGLVVVLNNDYVVPNKVQNSVTKASKKAS
jgi:purine-binding chemotaxis protein CheW